MQKIIPHLWFDSNAQEAVNFYASVFRKGSVGETTRYTEAGYEVHKMKAGTILTIEFSIEGVNFVALNGGPVFTFTPAISFMVHCPSQEEVEELCEKLLEGGSALMPVGSYPFIEKYGWIKDKYGLTWQIIYTKGGVREIHPSLMYVGDMAGKAEEAMRHYVSVFKDSKIGTVSRYPAGGADKEGSITYADFYLEGKKFSVMDSAGPHKFNFNEAVSLLVLCKDQAEIDYFWNALNRDVSEGQCGWLHDRWGVSWQVAPEGIGTMLNSKDRAAANRMMAAFMEMKKVDIAELKRAFDGK